MRFWPAVEIESHIPNPKFQAWDLVSVALTDFDVAAIDDNAPDAWRVFFHTPEGRDRAADALRTQFPHLTTSRVDVADEDWAARTQANLKAVRVGSIIVAPPWDVDSSQSGVKRGATTEAIIVIQPSMGFGTGHHATTRLCLAHLQALDLQGRSVIDVGAGSGVLALAASRLGAAHVLAIDDDADAIQSARANVDLNPGVDVTLGVVDLRRASLRPFDIVLANLTGSLLVAAAASLQRLTAPGGQLLLSGYMSHEAADVLAAFAGCAVDRQSQEDGWECVTLSNPSEPPAV